MPLQAQGEELFLIFHCFDDTVGGHSHHGQSLGINSLMAGGGDQHCQNDSNRCENALALSPFLGKEGS